MPRETLRIKVWHRVWYPGGRRWRSVLDFVRRGRMKFSGELLSFTFEHSGGEDEFYNSREEGRRAGCGRGSILAENSGFRV
jgi:hypothetical protein